MLVGILALTTCGLRVVKKVWCKKIKKRGIDRDVCIKNEKVAFENRK